MDDLAGSNPPQKASLPRSMPRLAVMSDLYIERTAGGELLLHRLLSGYPTSQLLIIYNAAQSRRTINRQVALPSVVYQSLDYEIPRLCRKEYNPFVPWIMRRHLGMLTDAAVEAIRDFGAEGVLTVPAWYHWLVAAKAAARLSLPLHMLIYDDWPSNESLNRPGWRCKMRRAIARQLLGSVYRQAASRLCVSPGMRDAYLRDFGIDGTVLYPHRGTDSPVPLARTDIPPCTVPVVAYAGKIMQRGITEQLRTVAEIMRVRNGFLDLYTPHSDAELDDRSLRLPHVRNVGFLSPAELAERVRLTAHAMLLPASFDPQEKFDTSTLFPSKLADYTAIGIPILIWGPEYSSASTWGSENPRAAALVTQNSSTVLASVLLRILNDLHYSKELAVSAVEAGNQYFSLESAKETFLRAITRT